MNGLKLRFVGFLIALPLLVIMADRLWSQGPIYKSKDSGVYANYQYTTTYYTEGMGTGSVGSIPVTIGSRNVYVDVREIEEDSYQFYLNINLSTQYEYGYLYVSGMLSDDYVSFDKPANHNLLLSVDTSDPTIPLGRYYYGFASAIFPVVDMRWDRTNDEWYRWEGHHKDMLDNFLSILEQGKGTEYRAEISAGIYPLPEPNFPAGLEWYSSSSSTARIGNESAKIQYIQHGP